jgi:hypothetical protein
MRPTITKFLQFFCSAGLPKPVRHYPLIDMHVNLGDGPASSDRAIAQLACENDSVQRPRGMVSRPRMPSLVRTWKLVRGMVSRA